MMSLTSARLRYVAALVAVAFGVSVTGFAKHASATIPAPTNCQSDVQGANDQPGQKDVTEFCVDTGNNAPIELYTSMAIDLVALPGGNTADVCTLYDTDNDGNVNLAVCVTMTDHGNPAALGDTRLFTCADTRTDRCTSSVQINTCSGGASCLTNANCPLGQTCAQQFDTACEVSQQSTDPFPAGDNYPVDSVAVCQVDLDDFGAPGASARIIDACSYPSTIPNSDPSDCVLFQGCTLSSQCDDSNPCTTDACNVSGICTHTPTTGASCDDGDVCTVNTTCSALGFCEGGTALNCSDNNACTTDTCNALTGCAHANVTNGTPCDDGAFCTTSDTCTAGICGGLPRDCGDGIVCTVDTCNELTDQCDHAGNDALCSDGLFCNGAETCNLLTGCEAGTPVNCMDAVGCTVDACNEATDQCDHTPNHAACSNGLFCDGTETCNVLTGCQAGTAINCSDGVACTVDACNEATDQCDHTPNHAACSNGLFCDGTETCNATLGCQAGTPVDCGDGVACTADSCNEAGDSCNHVVNDAACSNGLFCDGTETCNATLGCQPGAPVNCDDGIACTGDLCNEATDQCDHTPSNAACSNGLFCDGVETCSITLGCQVGTPVDCNDSVSCTTDACNEASDQCDHTPSNAACDDGLFCNGAETCDAIDDCEPGPDPCLPQGCNEATDMCVGCTINSQCDDGEFCNGTETCNVGTGNCNPGTPVSCNDGVACTTDACDEGSDQCVYTPDDSSCSDGAYCNGTEVCNALSGCQAGTPVSCTDGIACTADVCNEMTDQCDHTPNNASCSDGLFCNGVETCHVTLGCQPGTAPDCGDGIPCTNDNCNELADTCNHVANDAACSNGLFCDGTETCNVLTGCQPGTAVNCNDGVACTADLCNEATDNCDHTPNNATCNNGLFCDGTETCNVLTGCQPGTPVNCADSVACTGDTCNEATDNCDHTPNNAACDNGQFCDVDTCNPVTGCQFAPINCTDGVVCTLDTCNETLNQCEHATNDAVCSNGSFCDGTEICDAADDCIGGAPVSCGDSVSCTVDSCNEVADRCDHARNNVACSDGLACTLGEICDPTIGDPLTGCVPGTPKVCPVDTACTIYTCEEPTAQCVAEDLCCGNGTIDEDEECEPAPVISETCDDMIDNDADDLIDCLDPDCSVTGCKDDCTTFNCTLIEKDPAVIKVNETAFEMGSLKIHGRVAIDMAAFGIDFRETGFGFLLLNANGPIIGDDIDGTGFIRKGFGRYMYRNKAAAQLGGLAKVRTKLRLIDDQPYLSFALTAYGDTRTATLALMTTMVYGLDDVGVLTATWARRKTGWSLKPRDY